MPIRILCHLLLMLVPVTAVYAQRQMEHLDRGVVAVREAEGTVFVGWRLLGTDREGVAFNVYRVTKGEKPVRLNEKPLTGPTHFIDGKADLSKQNAWFVRTVIDGHEGPAAKPFVLKADAPVRQYVRIPLKTPAGYRPNDASVGDLDGDGEYEIVLKVEQRPRDNSHSGFTGQTKLEAYNLDGTFLWRIDLGRNIREGAHYTQFMVYDLDGDGQAEIACKTADGTVDGRGTVIGDPKKDWRNRNGYVLDGPEFFTVFNGETGAAMATAKYVPPRGRVRDWGDGYGNRVDRFLACIAYLDGKRPSLVMCRGYYTRTVLVAWNWRGGKLTPVWTFDSHAGGRGNRAYAGQGNHSLSVGDVDGDGKDEIIYGACVIDDNGKGLYSTRLGHGDALHFGDLDPKRPGLEIFDIHEKPQHEHGIEFRDAKTGKILWSKPSPDVGRGLSLDIDPRHAGHECWASGRGLRGLYNCKGETISRSKPRSCNMGVWWDGDLLRELLDGTTISKWDYENRRDRILFSGRQSPRVAPRGTAPRGIARRGIASNNGSKANPCLCADLFGDWREEVIWRSRDNRELRIYTTTIPTRHRFYTFMHDSTYRLSIAWQNVGYNQPAHTGFFMGHGMQKPPRPNIATPGRSKP